MIFAFEFQLTVDKLTKPADDAAKKVDRLTAALEALRKITNSVDGILGKVGPRVGKAFDGEQAASRSRTSMAKIAEEWQRMAAKAEAAEARATKAAEREAQRRMAIRERESRAGERMWTRIAFAAQRKQDRAAELAAHKPWFGGHKSVMDLLSARAESKVSGMATGAADFALGLPGMALGGIGGLALSGVKMAASAAIDLAKWSGEAAFNFGKMAIGAQSLRENSVKGFESIYGDKATGDKLFDQAVRIAKLTKFDTPDVVESFNTLAFAGKFKSDVVPMLFSAGADIASARTPQKGQQFLRWMGELNSAPEAFWGGFKGAANAGPGIGTAMDALIARTGLKVEGNKRLSIMNAMKQGKISNVDAMNALLDAVQQTYDKKEGGGLNALGSMARAQGEGTWEGLISNIRNGLQDVLTMKLPDGHPMLKFKDILVAMNRVFDETTENGKRFQALVSRLVEDVFMIFDLDSTKDKTAIEKAMSNVIGLAEALETKIRGVSVWLRENVTKPIFEGLSGDLGASLAGKLKSGFIDLGITLGKAVAVGMFDALGLSGKAKAIEAALKGPTAHMLAPPKTSSELRQEQDDAALNSVRRDMGLAPMTAENRWSTGDWQVVGMGAEKTADALGAPKMARGSTVTRPTVALIGERGTEHVIPDHLLRSMGGVHIGQVVIQLPAGAGSMASREYGEEVAQAFMQWVGTQVRSPSLATIR